MKKQLRRHKDGTFRYNSSNFSGLKLMIVTTAISACVKIAYDPTQPLLSPCQAQGCPVLQVPKVYAVEPVKELTIEEKIRAAFPEDPDMAVHVAFCESSLNPKAKSKSSTASGLYQIIKGTWKGYKCGDNPFDPDQNIACARKIYQRNGWGSTASWAASKPCWSK